MEKENGDGTTYLERGDAIAVFLVVEPLSFVLESVGSFADAKSGSFVILPLAHVRLRNVGIQRLVLCSAPRAKRPQQQPTTTTWKPKENVCDEQIVNKIQNLVVFSINANVISLSRS